MVEVADVFRRYGTEYLQKFGERMLPSHRRAFKDVLRCRTPVRDNYLVSVNALSRLFRSIFRKSMERCFKDIRLPRYVWQKDWVVHCKPAFQGTRTVLNYLARYIHRVAITNSRIISIDNGKVTFRCPSIQRKNAPNWPPFGPDKPQVVPNRPINPPSSKI